MSACDVELLLALQTGNTIAGTAEMSSTPSARVNRYLYLILVSYSLYVLMTDAIQN